jgi:hypothetical protein
LTKVTGEDDAQQGRTAGLRRRGGARRGNMLAVLHSRHRRAELDRERAAIVAKALRDNPGRTLDEAKPARAKLPGDPWGLRGIPAVGRGWVGGAIARTRPDEAVQ